MRIRIRKFKEKDKDEDKDKDEVVCQDKGIYLDTEPDIVVEKELIL
mgnify:CR=1 FL=1